MPSGLKVGRDIPQRALAPIDGVARQFLRERDRFGRSLGDTLAPAALARLGFLSLASLPQLGDKGLLLELGDGA